MWYVYDIVPDTWMEEPLEPAPSRGLFISPKIPGTDGLITGGQVCKCGPFTEIVYVDGPFPSYPEAEQWVIDNMGDSWVMPHAIRPA